MNIGISDDYAIVYSGKYRYYYGYEYTIDNKEWCFVIKDDYNEICRYSTSYLIKNCKGLDRYNQDEPWAYLIAGMALYHKENENY